jgi:D-3-phosphoglycerate dehydrogenase
MNKVLTFNNIAAVGLERLPRADYETSSEIQNPDAIILRSHKLHDYETPESLKCVGRAGAGVNNVPVERMTNEGVVVFNAPGANANAVKELVIVGMLLAARNICQAWDYTNNLNEEDDAKLNVEVEAGKKKYVGFELPGKTLAVIGLGAIGVKVANAAVALGMNVVGYDPVITVGNAWKLSAEVKQAATVDEAFRAADFVTFHVPLIEPTRNMLNAERLTQMKDGVVVLNLARGGIVNDTDVLAGLESGKVGTYVTDFPSNEVKENPGVIALPHLGASTGEAEENCAIMVADQVKDFLENGNIQNSVNFPNVVLPRAGAQRLSIANANRPDMVGQISHILGNGGVNICHMVNESRGEVAYTLVDVESEVSADVVEKIQAIDGVLKVQTL